MSGSRGRITDYGWWQLRDYASGPMIWTVLAGFVLGAFPLIMLWVHGIPADFAGGVNPIVMLFGSFIGILSFSGPVLAVRSLVSRDRHPGLTRFLFSKPIRVDRYYGQAWAIRGVTLLAITALAGAAINAFISAVPWAGGVATVAVSWVLIGGVGLLLSVLTRSDTGLLVGVYLIPDMLQQLYQLRPTWKWADWLLTVMPPMHRLDDIRQALNGQGTLSQSYLWHALLYGAVCAVLALVLVRRLPLVR